MARYLHKTLALSEFSSAQPYCFRRSVEEKSLFASVCRSGVLQPLIITKAKEILAGHKRYAAARHFVIKELEVLELTREITPQEGFLLAVFSNWNQVRTDFDKAYIVHRAVHEFNFKESEIRDEIFPALGPDLEKEFYEEALDVMSLSSELLEAIALNNIPFRGSKILRRFVSEDQKVFAEITQEAGLTTNQLLKSGEWLYDLLKLSARSSLRDLLQQNQFDEILKSPQDRKAKGDRFFAKVRALRYPHVTEREKQFAALAQQLRDPSYDLGVERPPFFEGEGIIMKAKLTNPQSLDRVLEAIGTKRKVLNSLLDIVL